MTPEELMAELGIVRNSQRDMSEYFCVGSCSVCPCAGMAEGTICTALYET